MDFKDKYLNYKNKYLNLKSQVGGAHSYASIEGSTFPDNLDDTQKQMLEVGLADIIRIFTIEEIGRGILSYLRIQKKLNGVNMFIYFRKINNEEWESTPNVYFNDKRSDTDTFEVFQLLGRPAENYKYTQT